MIERDYLLRLLKQFFDGLNELLFNIKTDDIEQAQFNIEALYEKYFQHKRNFFIDNELPIINQVVINNDTQSSAIKSEMLAELLLIDGNMKRSTKQRKNLLAKALFLFEYAEQNSNTYSEERLNKITSLKNDLG
ncbi:MAG TPA: hypothetical protein PLS94_04085 [Prolixibacteraceae bacterium]|nr:hypothetical protein [Prolixibacteraceae bacterium]